MRKLLTTVTVTLSLVLLFAATSPAGSIIVAGITATLVD